MKLYSILGILILTILGFWACQYSLEQEAKSDIDPLNPVLTGLSSEDSVFAFLAEEGFDYEFQSGTQVSIPKDAMVDHSGTVINGLVELSFKEYRDALDLLVAGIMMNPESGMTKTAGAIKLEVAKNGKRLFLDPTKSIAIKLACYEKGDDYNLYYQPEKNSPWEYLLSVKPSINEDHVHLERRITRMKPHIKFPLDEDQFALNYKGILDVVYNNNLTNVNHTLTQKKMEKYGLRWLNINVDSFIEYNGNKVLASSMVWQNVSRKPVPKWTKDRVGRIEKIKNNRYRLVVEDETRTNTFSTQLKALISLEELFSYGPGYWKSNYFTTLKNISATHNVLQNMPSTFRSFRINRFGIFNWQRTIEEEESVQIMVHLKKDEVHSSKAPFTDFYYLSGDSKGILHYPESKWGDFVFFEDANAKIFSILPNNEFWLFPADRLRSIEMNQLKKMKSPSFIFKMEITDHMPDSIEDLRDILETNS